MSQSLQYSTFNVGSIYEEKKLAGIKAKKGRIKKEEKREKINEKKKRQRTVPAKMGRKQTGRKSRRSPQENGNAKLVPNEIDAFPQLIEKEEKKKRGIREKLNRSHNCTSHHTASIDGLGRAHRHRHTERLKAVVCRSWGHTSRRRNSVRARRRSVRDSIK